MIPRFYNAGITGNDHRCAVIPCIGAGGNGKYYRRRYLIALGSNGLGQGVFYTGDKVLYSMRIAVRSPCPGSIACITGSSHGKLCTRKHGCSISRIFLHNYLCLYDILLIGEGDYILACAVVKGNVIACDNSLAVLAGYVEFNFLVRVELVSCRCGNFLEEICACLCKVKFIFTVSEACNCPIL